MVEKSNVDNENSSNYEEIFHHLRFAEHKSSMFFGREDLIGDYFITFNLAQIKTLQHLL